MADPDTSLYDLLGCLPSDEWEAIHAAYKIARSKHHPDKGGDEELFKQIQDAYNLLSDRALRKAYDAGEIGPDGKPAKKSEEDEILDVARQGLMQMLSQLLEIDKPIFETLLQAIAKHDQDANALIAKLRRDRNKLETRLKHSIKFKGGKEDLLGIIAKQKIDAWTKQIAGCERSLKIFAEGRKMALALQKQYEEVGERPEIIRGVQMFQFDQNFDPEELHPKIAKALGEMRDYPGQPDPKDQGCSGYRSPYGPQSGRKR